jgi:hypothetical protein
MLEPAGYVGNRKDAKLTRYAAINDAFGLNFGAA